MSDAINRLVEHVVSTRYEDLPHEAIEAAKMLTLDTVGVGIAGSSGPHVDKILAVHAQPGAARLLGQIGRAHV